VELVRALEEATSAGPSHVTIGAFDGVHRGHRHLVGSMVEAARAAGRVAVAITFDPHPGTVLGRRPVAVLSTIEQRAALLAEIGLDLMAVLQFTPAVAGTSAERFATTLCRQLRMAELWVGPDFALGHRREGNVAFLRKIGQRLAFSIRVVEPLHWQGKAISSTRIRDALTVGDIAEANGCLGRPYRLSGTVINGRDRGHRLGFPTANIEPPLGRLIPVNGVYVCWANTQCDGVWPAVVNVGVCPTVVQNHLTLAAHLLDYEGDLGGQHLSLDFVARLRDEVAFLSLDALARQIRKDIVQARRVLSSSPGQSNVSGLPHSGK
jgi:riboflavin kinase/FMN adenylyltransferase